MKAHLLYRSGEREFIARRNNDSMKKEKKEENMGKFRWVAFLIKKLEYGEDMLEKLFRIFDITTKIAVYNWHVCSAWFATFVYLYSV